MSVLILTKNAIFWYINILLNKNFTAIPHQTNKTHRGGWESARFHSTATRASSTFVDSHSLKDVSDQNRPYNGVHHRYAVVHFELCASGEITGGQTI